MLKSSLRSGPATAVVALCGYLSSLPALASGVNDQVLSLSETRRHEVFAKLISRSGERCSSVSRAFYQGSASDGAAFWSLSCRGGIEWQVMLKPDGSTRLLECKVLKAVNGGTCFTKFK
jgi:hypothetical protein